jgi:hypothetical protein
VECFVMLSSGCDWSERERVGESCLCYIDVVIEA